MILRAMPEVALATGRATLAGQVKGDGQDERGYPGPPGWGLDVRLTTSPCKKTNWSYRKNARHRNPKEMYGKLYATRRRGRPKMRWLDDVSTDLRKMGINEWRDRARD
jgi:hypothetical protein